MARAGIQITRNAVEEKLNDMISKGRSLEAGVARDVTKIYANAQRARWMSEGSSEGTPWRALNPKYKESKPIRFSAYPGGGRKMMIARGDLFMAATLQKLGADGGSFIVQGSTLTININIDHATHANQARNFTRFGSQTRDKIKQRLKEYLFG